MAVTYNSYQTTYPAYIYTYNGTYSANRNGTTAFDYFDDDASAEDAIYFGAAVNSGVSRSIAFHNLNFYVGTALAADAITLAWEYYNGSSWVALGNVVDNTNSFQTTGENDVTWDFPKDWVRVTVNSVETYWVRCRITAVTNITEGGAQSTQAVEGCGLFYQQSFLEF